MAIATKPKPKTVHHKKRTAGHHRHTKHYVKSYWPYIPMLMVVGVGIVLSSFMSHPRAILGWQQNLNQEALLLETNNDRRAHTRQPLTLNKKLSQAAQSKAQDMVYKDYWSHNTPSGQEPWTFINAAGYQYWQAGENLAYGFTSADSVLNAWMHSPEHRTNVLETSYNEVGFGVAQSPNFRGKGAQTIVVAMYGLSSSTPVDTVEGVNGSMINLTNSAQSVSRMEAIAPTLSGVVVGIVGTLAIIVVFVRHAIAWRKLIKRGERFILKHPIFDTVLVAIAVSAVLLTQTAGFIR